MLKFLSATPSESDWIFLLLVPVVSLHSTDRLQSLTRWVKERAAVGLTGVFQGLGFFPTRGMRGALFTLGLVGKPWQLPNLE